MHGLRRWLAATFALSVCSVWQIPIAFADERTDARREFRAGMQAVAEGRYDEGIAHLETAYDTLPHPNVLYNIGLAHMYAGRADEAISYFERYKETAPPSDQVEIDSLIASLKGKSEAAAVAEPGATESPGQTDAASAIETAAREVRRMADETHNDALKRQADDLDATAKALRAGQPVPDATPKPTTATPETPKPVQATAETKQTREGVYEEEVVSASRFAQSPLDAPNATAIITAQDIRMTGLVNMTDIMRRVLGMEITQVTPTHSEVSIRGLNRRSSNKVLFLVDGRSFRLDFLGTSWFNQMPIPLENVERIEIIKGPASALYGADAFSGIVNVITKKTGEGKPYVSGSYGSDQFARGVGSFTGRSNKLAYRFSTVYSQTLNAVVAVGPDRTDVKPLTPSQEWSRRGVTAESEITYSAPKNTLITFGANTAYGDSTVQGLSRLGQVTAYNAVDSRVYTAFAMPLGFKVGSWYNHVTSTSGPSYVTPGAVDVIGTGLKQDVADVDAAWSGRFKLLVPQSLTVGGGYRYKHVEWAWLNGVHTQHHFGAYLQDVLQLAKPLTLQLGARVDHHPLLTNVQFSPRGSLVYRFLEQQSLRVSIGRAFRGPSFLESYVQLQNGAPQRGATGLGLGNDKLDPESIVSYELGYQNQASDYFSLEANVYFNMVKDAILFTNINQYTLQDYGGGDDLAVYDPSVNAFPFSSIQYTNEQATFRQIGGELGIRVYPVPGLDIYANYSIHDTQPMDKSKIDSLRAQEQQTSMHKVNGGIQYRARFGLDLSGDVSYTSPQTWIEQVTDPGRGVKFQSFDVPYFVMVTARIGYRLFDDQLELGLVGTNLAFQDKRQHPYAQPIDTRVYGTVRLRF